LPDLDFKIENVEAVPYAQSPQLAFKLLIQQTHPEDRPAVQSLHTVSFHSVSIHSVILRCQLRLEPARRRYSPDEQQQLGELFGEPHRWGQTVRSTLWTNVSVSVPPFTHEIRVNLVVPCTYDFNVASTKYFAALSQGEVPLSFLFSGTIFYAADDGSFQVEQISWEKEAEFRLPVSVWRTMMDMYYPNTAWLCLRQDVFDRLSSYRINTAMPTWEQAIEKLLNETAVLPDEVAS
jgi:hypothetical protein